MYNVPGYSYEELAGLSEQQIQRLNSIKNTIPEHLYVKCVDIIAKDNARKSLEEYKSLMEKQNTLVHRFVNFCAWLIHAPRRLVCDISCMIEQKR
jgi:hypothetical protein